MTEDYRLPVRTSRPYHALTLTTRTEIDMSALITQLVNFLKQQPSCAEASYTVCIDEQEENYRSVAIYQNNEEAISAFETQDPQKIFYGSPLWEGNAVLFMFSGQGTQYLTMGREIYCCKSFFRDIVDDCAEKLLPHLSIDIRKALYPDTKNTGQEQIHQAIVAQPVLFVIEYALARLLMHWGIKPQAMIGHSIGEYVAATLSGVISLEDALLLIALRSQLIQQQPPGIMLSVMLSEPDLKPFLDKDVALAAVNSPQHCVVAGAYEPLN